MRVEVDQTGEDDETGDVDRARAGAGQPGSDLGDHPVLDEDVGRTRSLDLGAAEEQDLAHRGFSFSVADLDSSRSAPARSR
jgi:hypothetical protein